MAEAVIAEPDASAGPLLAVLADCNALLALSAVDLDMLLRQARRTNLLSRIALDASRLEQRLPKTVRAHFDAARTLAADQDRMLRWEVNRLERALAGLAAPVVLLKGAAYALAELPLARGRLVSDVDILVPRPTIGAVEEALLRHGWEHVKLEPYDQRYYRRWMHELPPLRHRDRNTIVDVHHRILPLTSRLHPDPNRQIAAARALADSPFRVLAPADMLLHSATHLFHDGDLSLALRDLVDVHDLLVDFRESPAFWEVLVARARELELARPLFYALRYAAGLLGTPVPADVMMAAARAGAPSAPLVAMMDRLVPLALMPDHPDRPGRQAAAARRLLYVRSHWVRMPSLLLARHLARKALGTRRENGVAQHRGLPREAGPPGH